jgi:hypothetical protein
LTTRLICQTNTGRSARLAANWLSCLQRLKIDDRASVYCVDDESTAQLVGYCTQRDIKARVFRFCQHEPQALPRQDKHPWGTAVFMRLSLWKVDLMCQLSAQRPFEPFLYTDTDVVLLGNPEANLLDDRRTQPGVSLFFQSDREDYADPQTVPIPASGTKYCTGIVYQVNPESRLWSLAYEWMKAHEGGPFVHDQHAVCEILETWCRVPGYLSPTWCRNGALDWNNNPVLVHANYSVEDKEQRFRRNNLWFADDELLREVGL